MTGLPHPLQPLPVLNSHPNLQVSERFPNRQCSPSTRKPPGGVSFRGFNKVDSVLQGRHRYENRSSPFLLQLYHLHLLLHLLLLMRKHRRRTRLARRWLQVTGAGRRNVRERGTEVQLYVISFG